MPAVPDINPAGRYILKNHIVGRTPKMTPVNEYLIYDENLKVIQHIHCTVTQIKEKTEGLENLTPVSAAWLNKQGAFDGQK